MGAGLLKRKLLWRNGSRVSKLQHKVAMKMARASRLFTLTGSLLVCGSYGQRSVFSLNPGWKFELENNGPPPACADPNTTFPIPLDGQQCSGLTQVPYAADVQACIDACCAEDSCETWQFCSDSSCSPVNSCWIGAMSGCTAGKGWISRGRNVTPTPTPTPGAKCDDARCEPGTDDSKWRVVNVPHDFVVEGDPSQSAE